MKIKLYRNKYGKLVQAHRFSGGELIQLANWVDKCRADHTTSAIFEDGEPTLIITYRDTDTRLKHGQWLVRTEHNLFVVLDNDKFESEYTKQGA